MEFRILGPLEVWADGVAVPTGTPKQQVVLAVMLANANRLVSVDELVDELWPDDPPPSAVANVRGYAGKIRRACEATTAGEDRLIRRGAGYVLYAKPSELDMLAFLADTAAGRMAVQRGDLEVAALRFDVALARWRGAVAGGLPHGPSLDLRCTALEDERLAVVDELAQAYLRLDQPDRVVALLREHVRAHPLRERSHSLLMRALHRVGDIAGALAAYADARSAIVDQLGIEPGEELRRLQQALLDRHPETERSDPSAAEPTARITLLSHPRELPPEIAHFVGREAEFAEARAAIASPARPRRHRAAVVVLHGPGGSGKSALAVHLAHEMADMFPEGQLYVDLLGSTPGLRPLATVDVLQRLLRRLGVPNGQIPHSAGDAAARFRTLTAGRRLLIVLDNAHDASQLAELLPASDASAVLVTCRPPLGSVEADRRIRLAGLPRRDGLALLAQLTQERIMDQDQAERVVALCDHLPLALRIVAGRLSNLPTVSAADFAERLADRRRRLDELELDGLAVRTSIGVGYEALVHSERAIPRLAARVFRLLGLLNVPDFRPEVVAAMLGDRDSSAARAALDHLVSVGLLEPSAAGRYRLHDLVRLFSVERAATEEDSHAAAEALHSGLSYYAGALFKADRLQRPGRMTLVGEPPIPPHVLLPGFSTIDQARAWVDAELSSLVAAAEQASSRSDGSRRMALHIGEALWESLYRRQDWTTARRLGTMILDAAQRHGDREVAGWAHIAVGRSAADFCEWDLAVDHFEQALSIQSELGNHQGIALSLNSLGVVNLYLGDLVSGERYYSECLEFVRKHHMRAAEGVLLHNLGVLYIASGRYRDAIAAGAGGLAVRRELEDPVGVSTTLNALAAAYCLANDLDQSFECASEAISISRQVGDQLSEHFNLVVRSEVNLRRGDVTGAMADVEEAHVSARQRGDMYTQALTLRQKSRLLTAAGHHDEAARIRHEAERALGAVRTRPEPMLEALFGEPGRATGSTSEED
jgi:DNA-binding SARP family transcriptional activator/tetratricopeptide (TPR) repeat protein